MNSVFKVIWCAVTQRCIVVSELAKSKSKSKSSSPMIMGTMAILISMSYAQSCEFDANGVMQDSTCLRSVLVTDAVGEYKVSNVIMDAQKNHDGGYWIQDGAIALLNTADQGDVSLSVDGLNLINNNFASGVYVSLRDTAEGNLALDFSGENNVVLGKLADTAVMLENFSEKGGNSTITIHRDATLNVKNYAVFGGEDSSIADAIESNTHHGDASIYFLGKGLIETNNGNAIFARVLEGTGNVNILLDNPDINIEVENSKSKVHIHEEGVHGVSAAINPKGDKDSKITIDTAANIKVTGSGVGIFSRNEGLGETTIINRGNVVSDAYGIYLIQYKSQGAATIMNNGIVDASNGQSAIVLSTNQQGVLNFGQNSVLKGGSEAGVFLAEGSNQLNNEGKISAKNDLAIRSTSQLDSSITNSGTITGRILADAKMDFVNEKGGVFELRHVENDTKNVAVSNFAGGNIDNQGTIKFVKSNATQVDKTGELAVPGVNNISVSETGIVQAHLAGVNEFKHSGIIDLRGEGLSGNVLKISGHNGAMGTFIANGGDILLSTTLNKGAEASRSDMLILDNVQLGDAASNIYITKIEESEVQTEAHGIRLIQTLGTQDNRAFKLGNAVTYGLYEYKLSAVDTNGNGEQGFYLVNFDPTKPTDPEVPIDPSELLKNPVVGAYLGMQYAAANMFNQNILDRRDNVRKPDETVWGRIQYNETKTKHMENTQSLKIENTLIQLGWDLYQDQNEERGKVFGIYGGYGYSDVKNRSLQTGTKTDGRVHGYQLGAYYSWFKQDDIGPYIDMWGHLAKYRNKLKSATYEGQRTAGSTSYNGHGFAISIEAGHGFIVGQSDDNNTSWVLEPHAQVTYNYIKMKNMVDGTGTRFRNNKAKGLNTRLGARFYGYRDNNDALRPYVEMNWLHNGMDNAIYVNNMKESSRIGRNVWEMKVGAQGHVSKDISLFAHVGYQKGKNKFKNTELQIGFNYNF
ncbi:autotransporter outer membrane beta-barrel domain-containing protein [Wohlfahrtiimonas larvae]|uniref:Autotransporter domain-containing protein n=1 Tax=Wohlfahrtiimonas larvae TaxID=1157986 RepID=A0ABP9MUV2_9GAMM|nr:autotransporter outer membrane beta-barrel domain-containing protein [Wohlfahrtiimonas larvae]